MAALLDLFCPVIVGQNDPATHRVHSIALDSMFAYKGKQQSIMNPSAHQ